MYLLGPLKLIKINLKEKIVIEVLLIPFKAISGLKFEICLHILPYANEKTR